MKYTDFTAALEGTRFAGDQSELLQPSEHPQLGDLTQIPLPRWKTAVMIRQLIEKHRVVFPTQSATIWAALEYCQAKDLPHIVDPFERPGRWIFRVLGEPL